MQPNISGMPNSTQWRLTPQQMWEINPQSSPPLPSSPIPPFSPLPFPPLFPPLLSPLLSLSHPLPFLSLLPYSFLWFYRCFMLIIKQLNQCYVNHNEPFQSPPIFVVFLNPSPNFSVGDSSPTLIWRRRHCLHCNFRSSYWAVSDMTHRPARARLDSSLYRDAADRSLVATCTSAGTTDIMMS